MISYTFVDAHLQLDSMEHLHCALDNHTTEILRFLRRWWRQKAQVLGRSKHTVCASRPRCSHDLHDVTTNDQHYRQELREPPQI